VAERKKRSHKKRSPEVIARMVAKCRETKRERERLRNSPEVQSCLRAWIAQETRAKCYDGRTDIGVIDASYTVNAYPVLCAVTHHGRKIAELPAIDHTVRDLLWRVLTCHDWGPNDGVPIRAASTSESAAGSHQEKMERGVYRASYMDNEGRPILLAITSRGDRIGERVVGDFDDEDDIGEELGALLDRVDPIGEPNAEQADKPSKAVPTAPPPKADRQRREVSLSIDAILDKLSRSGMKGLTRAERAALEAESRRLRNAA
jgi:hypothetical protein